MIECLESELCRMFTILKILLLFSNSSCFQFKYGIVIWAVTANVILRLPSTTFNAFVLDSWRLTRIRERQCSDCLSREKIAVCPCCVCVSFEQVFGLSNSILEFGDTPECSFYYCKLASKQRIDFSNSTVDWLLWSAIFVTRQSSCLVANCNF